MTPPPPAASLLLIDDHPANLLALEAVLEPLGQRLVRATSGAEALRRLMQEEFALVILDVQMPGIDGFETARLIRERERTRHVPILFLTARSSEDVHVFQGYAHGAVDYLVKPVDPDILRAKVGALVALHHKEVRERRAAGERARLALERRNAERFRALLDLLPTPAWATGPGGEVEACNAAWERFSGLSPAQTGRQGFFARVHPDERERARATWEQALARGEPVALELRLAQGEAGAWVTRTVHARPVREEGGRVEGWVGLLHPPAPALRAHLAVLTRALAGDAAAREAAPAALAALALLLELPDAG